MAGEKSGAACCADKEIQVQNVPAIAALRSSLHQCDGSSRGEHPLS